MCDSRKAEEMISKFNFLFYPRVSCSRGSRILLAAVIQCDFQHTSEKQNFATNNNPVGYDFQ